MNKNGKDILILGFISFGIFVLPTIINNYFVEKKTDTFFQRVDEDFDYCVKHANEDAKAIDWCRKIKNSSELAFKSAKRVSYSDFDIFFPQAVLFALAAITLNLKRRVESLENK